MFERREILDFSSIWFSGKAKDKTAATPDNPANNYGYDDERGDYLIHVGDHLAYRYEILAMVGSGKFLISGVIELSEYSILSLTEYLCSRFRFLWKSLLSNRSCYRGMCGHQNHPK